MTNKIADFYDNFSESQVKTGTNLRHYHLVNVLKENGLTSSSSLFEIGCGIGTVTKLLAGKIGKGKLVATDISPKTIEIARKRLPENVELYVSDMQVLPCEGTFDFILLADVLEHIPVEQHPVLFQNIRKLCHAKSKVIMNIPNPEFLDLMRNKHPEALQVIDQSLYANQLTPVFEQNGFWVDKMVSYSLFYTYPDYQLIVLKTTEHPLEIQFIPQYKIILRKAWSRFKSWF
ncbi:MAG: class I SAM-dependent methyltransferase [Cyclobacteriaceae bacterium]|nr:class I SAM-dependent methyltransferase [Cyclobacteriaceae bacterium]